jgi:hypothetical protein
MIQDLKVLALGGVVLCLALAGCFASYSAAEMIAAGDRVAITEVP